MEAPNACRKKGILDLGVFGFLSLFLIHRLKNKMFSPVHFLIGLLHPIFLYFCGKNTDKISYTKNPEVAQQKAYEEIKYSSEADCLGRKS